MGAIHKGKMSRLALSLVVVITLVLGLMPGAGVGKALADDAVAGRVAPALTLAADEMYPLWVGETQVTSTNLEGQGWSFAPAANDSPATLTLSGYSYTGSGHVETLQDYDGEWDYYRHAPIFWNADSELVVELAGENSIVVTADPADGSASEGSDGEEDEGPTHRYCGIFCAGNLTVRGAGSLAANAGDLEDGDAGIYAKGDVSIEGGSVSATGYDYGIYSYEGTVAIGANAGTVTAETTGSEHSLYGINAEYGDVRIDGGTVTAKGYRGISVGGDIVINGGEVSAQCSVPASFTTSITAPCAIACDYGTLTVNGGAVTATGHQYGIYAVRHPSSEETELAPGVVINGGSVVVESRESESSAIGINGCIMTVKGGSVQATGSGEKAYGVSAINSRGESGNGSLVIEKGIASFIAQGPAGAINADTSVKNAVAGLGYSDVAGTEGKTSIAANASKGLSSYKRVLFPATAASVTTLPAKKSLSYTGKPQKLVTAGVASGGTMQYSLDGKTYAAKLPTATDSGKYTVYYKVAGDASHVDSQVQAVTSIAINKARQSISAKKSVKATVTAKASGKKRVLAENVTVNLAKKAKVSAKTKVAYAKVGNVGGKKIAVAKKTGKVTLKKGLVADTYKVRVKLTAPASKNYKAAKARTVTLTVKVR